MTVHDRDQETNRKREGSITIKLSIATVYKQTPDVLSHFMKSPKALSKNQSSDDHLTLLTLVGFVCWLLNVPAAD